MDDYTRNHYVPVWYQKRFIPQEQSHNRLYYLNLYPQTRISPKGYSYIERDIKWQGPKKCFLEDNLYTTYFKEWKSNEIEEKFFGKIDLKAIDALKYFSSFNHPSANHEAFRLLIQYMSIQKLRTPKGLYQLSNYINEYDKNRLLIRMQELKNMYCAIWTESVWSILDASRSETKFLLSDHPITLYNKKCYPKSRYCTNGNDPDIRYTGTHTIFPINLNKVLVLTNLSWVRNPYKNPIVLRPNPNMLRDAIFNFQQIQINRMLEETEVVLINYIIKHRAFKYIAAANKNWLYPEDKLNKINWNDIGDSYFLMPDPRSVQFDSGVYIGKNNGNSEHFDEYGRTINWDPKKIEKDRKEEWDIFHAFIGEYSRLHGPKRNGVAFNFDKLDNAIDSSDYHAYNLSLESRFKKPPYRRRKKRKTI